MRLSVVDTLSIAGQVHNEDRAGQSSGWAWVIDGATDVLETPLLQAPSDAAWFADTLEAAMMRYLASPDSLPNPPDLDAMLRAVTDDVALHFRAAARRMPQLRHERPSAAGIFAAFNGKTLVALSLGDCTLARLDPDGSLSDLFRRDGERDADDTLRQAVANLQATAPTPVDPPKSAMKGIRSELMPHLRAARDLMNTKEGYGVFSLDLPPAEYITTITAPAISGDRFLFATDGFMRLVDVYAAYGWSDFGPALQQKGLARLAVELRDIEAADAAGSRHPRAKTRDDATAMILEVV